MTRFRQGAAALLLAAALILSLLGQIYFLRRPEYLWDGVVFHGLAAFCFVLAWRMSRPARPRLPREGRSPLLPWLRARPVPLTFFVASGLFSLVASLLARNRAAAEFAGDAGLLWVLSISSLVLAALWPASWASVSVPRLADRWRAVSRTGWLEAATVTLITVLAFVLRVAALDRVPFTLGGDEAWHGLLARQVIEGRLRNPFNMGFMSMPTLFYWPLSWSLRVVGDTLVGLRFPAALVGTLSIPLFYLFVRDLWGRRLAVLSALFLASYDYHVHFSRLGANNVWDPLFVILALWALDRGLARIDRGAPPSGQKAYRIFMAAGIVAGFGFYFYTGARLLPALVAVYAGFVWWQRRAELHRPGVYLLLMVLAFLIVAGPMLSFAQAHPAEWNARLNQVGILQSGWLEREPDLTGRSTTEILAEQFLRAAGAFHVFSDRTVWYGSDRPLLGFVAGALVVLGMAWAVVRWRDRRYFLVLIWFWSVILSGGMLTESPPSSQRLVMAIPAVVLLVSLGLDRLVGLLGRLLKSELRWEHVARGLLIGVLMVSTIRYYFVEFTPTRRYGSENGETATMMGYYLRDLGPGTRVYHFGAPRIYWGFGTMSFLAPEVTGTDVVEPLTSLEDLASRTAGASGEELEFLFLPDRLDELNWIQQAYPNGETLEFEDAGGRLRFVAYSVP